MKYDSGMKPLSEEACTMKELLSEKYGKELFSMILNYRKEHPYCSLEDAIRALFEEAN